jgi:hypothetical protein
MPDAHCRCHFGQWYYGAAHPELQGGPWFKNIGVFHDHARHARLLLIKRNSGQPVSDEYDQFMDLTVAQAGGAQPRPRSSARCAMWIA